MLHCQTVSHRDGGAVLEEVRLVGGHGDDGDAEVDPQHVDDAEAEEGLGRNSIDILGMSPNLSHIIFGALRHTCLNLQLSVVLKFPKTSP